MQRRSVDIQPHEPAAGAGDRNPEPDRVQQRGRPRPRRDDHLVGVDPSVVRHHADHPPRVLDSARTGRWCRTAAPRSTAISASATVKPAGASRWPWCTSQPPRTPGASDGSRPRTSSGASSSTGPPPRDRDRARSSRAASPLRRGRPRAARSGLRRVGRGPGSRRRSRGSVEAGPGHREQRRVGRREPQAVVPTRRARGEFLSLQEHDGCAAARELERARGPDDPPAHDHHVLHAGREPNAGPLESLAETWLSGRKQPPAKRLGG